MNLSHHARRIIDHVWGPTGSVILHIFIVILLVKFIVFDTTPRDPEIEVMVMEPDAVELEKFEQELEQLQEMDRLDDFEMPDVNIDMEQPQEVDFQQPDPNVDFAALDIQTDVQSPLVMKGLYGGRSSGGRSAGLSKFAGRYGKFTEASVIKALEWLRKNQLPDGSWKANHGGENSGRYIVGLSGLALLTFLAHGETPSSEEYGETVQRALLYLTEKQAKSASGHFDGCSYAHAIATYGVAEAFGMSRIPALKDSMDKGVDVIINGMQPNGSWDYSYKQTPRQDFSVAGWNLQALKAAKMSKSSHPRLDEGIKKGIQGIYWMYSGNGGWAYSRNEGGPASGGKPSMTSVGILVMQLLGLGNEPEAQAGLNRIAEMKLDYSGKKEWGNLHGYPPYTWYYATQAKFHKGGSTWSAWNRQFAPELVKNQHDEGFWEAPDEEAPNDAVTAGRIYATTLSALTLQVYYRFLPTYQTIAVTPQVDETSEDDVVIEII